VDRASLEELRSWAVLLEALLKQDDRITKR
jgi:hypothetical protein